MPEPICRACGIKFNDWGELASHINTSIDVRHKNKASKKWAKLYIHRNAINKLKKIGQNKELEPRQKLTPEQLEAKRDAKYTLSGQTKYVPCRCPKCKKGYRDFVEIEHVNSTNAVMVDNCFVKICEGCK